MRYQCVYSTEELVIATRFGAKTAPIFCTAQEFSMESDVDYGAALRTCPGFIQLSGMCLFLNEPFALQSRPFLQILVLHGNMLCTLG